MQTKFMRRIVDIDFIKKEITNYLCGLHTNMRNCKQIENFSWEKINSINIIYIYIYSTPFRKQEYFIILKVGPFN